MKNISQWTMTFALVTSLVTPSFKAFAKEAKNAVPNERVDVSIENDEQLTPEQQAELEKITYTQLVDPDSEFSKAIRKAIGDYPKELDERNSDLLKAIKEADKANTEEEKDNNNSKEKVSKRTRLQMELAKVKVEIPISLSASLLNFLDAGVEAKRTVQATNNNGEQLRVDTLEVKLKTSTKIYAGASIKITFAKVLKQSDFPGENLKMKAITEDFFWFKDLKNRIPTNASEVKSKLKVGQTFRLEIEGVLGAGLGRSDDTNKKKFNAGVGLGNGATFLVDIARVTETYTRTRFLGLKNRGSFTASVGGKAALFSNLISGEIGKALSLGAELGFEMGNRLLHKFPVDSMMVIYGFNSENPESQEALDQIFTNMKQFGFMRIFNPAADDQSLAQKLLEQAPLAEKLAKEDAKKTNMKEVRVKHEFRGRMTTQYYRFNIGGNFSILADARATFGGSTTFVRKFDANDKIQYFLIDNQNFQQQAQAGRNLKSFRDRSDLDLLVSSNVKEEQGQFLDLVVRNEHEETKLSKSELEALTKRIKISLPKSLAADPRIENYLPKGTQEDASYVIESSLGIDGYKALATIDRNQMVQNLIEYFDRHPNRAEMNLPSDNRNGEFQGAPLWEVAENIVHPMHRMLNGEENKDLSAEFGRLKGQGIFGKWVVGEFLPSQLPDASAKKMMRYTIKFSSDSGLLAPLELGESKPSEIYNAVKLIRRVLDDRGFDMRLEALEKAK